MARQAHQTDKLVRAGFEGFAILDELYGRNKKSAGRPIPSPQAYHHHHQHYSNYNNQHQYTYGGPQVITVIKEPIIDSNQAAQFYGGMTIVEYSMRKPSTRTH